MNFTGPEILSDLKRAIIDQRGDHRRGQRFTAPDETAEMRMLMWIGAHETEVVAACERAIMEVEDRNQKPAATISEDQLRMVRGRLKEDLDLVPPSKASKQEIRPMFPMTLADVIRVGNTPEQRTNPAPLWKTGISNYRTVNNIGSRYQVPSDHEIDLALAGEAWRMSAPEGFPPIPRRGGIYSHDEAMAILFWCRSIWPAMREWDQKIKQWERELRLMGTTRDPLGYHKTWLGATSPLRKCDSERLMEAKVWDENLKKMRYYFSPEGQTPRQFVADVERWCRNVFHHVYTVVIPILKDPYIYQPISRADKNVDQTFEKIKAVERYLDGDADKWLSGGIGLTHGQRNWLPNRGEETLIELVVKGLIKPSEALRLQREKEKEDKKRQEEDNARFDKNMRNVAQAMRPIRDRKLGWNSANIERHLPRGYTLGSSLRTNDPDVWIDMPNSKRIFVHSKGSKTETLEALGQMLLPLMDA
jgi:hypothetical protein